MNPQISFNISCEKEKAFIEFVRAECDCEVLEAWSTMPLCMVENDGGVSEHSMYFLVPKIFLHLVQYDIRQGDSGENIRYIDPGRTSVELENLGIVQKGFPYKLPYIEFRKNKLRKEGTTRCRLWAELTLLFPEHRNQIRTIYAKMKKWIQKNATSKTKLSTFFTIYNVL